MIPSGILSIEWNAFENSTNKDVYLSKFADINSRNADINSKNADIIEAQRSHRELTHSRAEKSYFTFTHTKKILCFGKIIF